MNILEKIVEHKKGEVEKAKNCLSFEALIEKTPLEGNPNRFYQSIENVTGTYLIAEVKKASPSCPEGFIPHFNHLDIAKEYITNNIPTISVLTDEAFFQGSIEVLKSIRKETSSLILRKDFIVDPYQIYEAKGMGADLILLIAAILTEKEMQNYSELAHKLGLGTLVEIHNEDELKKVRSFKPNVLGINNRNLKDFSIDIKRTPQLMEKVDFSCKVISESGIEGRSDVTFLEGNGVNGFLIGTSLVKSPNITEKIKELTGQ
ncbi:MAG: indole-3-glycerol phosphate synthase TrpC [Nitrospinae bacterium]|nr:indole-3-glycerol phosphate synthase TrpC [Nitrospinota bacterium]